MLTHRADSFSFLLVQVAIACAIACSNPPARPGSSTPETVAEVPPTFVARDTPKTAASGNSSERSGGADTDAGHAAAPTRAWFELDTGRDQMAAPTDAKLWLIVESGGEKLRREIAQCDDPSLGSALGGGTPDVLEVALCGEEYWLMAEPGAAVVRRAANGVPQGAAVVRVPLAGTDQRPISPRPEGANPEGRFDD